MRIGRFAKSYMLHFVFVSVILFCFIQCRQDAAAEFKSQGGLLVLLEPDFRHLLRDLSENNPDEKFNRALDQAYARQSAERRDFVELFVEELEKQDKDFHLAILFGTYRLKEKVSSQHTNEEVLLLLKDEISEMLEITMNGLAMRMKAYGVNPHIEWLGSEKKILVKMPGVKETDQPLRLLQSNTSLEFWETDDLIEIHPQLVEVDKYLAELLQTNHPLFTRLLLNQSIGAMKMIDDDLYFVYDPAFRNKLRPGAVVGYVEGNDREQVMKYLDMPEVVSLLPSQVVFKPGAKPVSETEDMYELYALKKTKGGGVALNGDVITEAKVKSDKHIGLSISIQMNAEGGDTWAKLTRDNIGKNIAIVLNDKVYSAPIVQSEITGGKAVITGHFTKEEARDLANMLNSGRTLLPVEVAHYELVPPTAK